MVIDVWGHHGPWAGRRGFDSVVQAATGLAAGESAAAALDGLRRQRRHGGTPIRRVSLARTAWWVATTPGRPGIQPEPGNETRQHLVELPADGHTIMAVAPPGTVAGQALRWPHAGHGYGADPPAWDLAPQAPDA